MWTSPLMSKTARPSPMAAHSRYDLGMRYPDKTVQLDRRDPMSNWQEKIAPWIRGVEKLYDRLKYRLYDAFGGPGAVRIVPYRGYGTHQRLFLMGRVLKDRNIPSAGEHDSLWRNFVNMAKRMASREVPHARLLARFQDVEQELVADEEGMFRVWIEPRQPLPADQLWHTVELALLEPELGDEVAQSQARASGEVLVPAPTSSFAVISDIDDTVLQTGAPHMLQMLRNVMLGNALTRTPLPGVAALYQALHAGQSGHDANPLFYVSNSPWNIYDLLVEFFQLHEIPVGPVLFLRNWGIYDDELWPTDHRKHKLPVIRQMVELFEDLPFILIGDSGESDPEIYYDIVRQYPGRIRAIYVRNAGNDLERPKAVQALAERVVEAGSTLVLSDDSLTLARHAAREGWIQSGALQKIENQRYRLTTRARR